MLAILLLLMFRPTVLENDIALVRMIVSEPSMKSLNQRHADRVLIYLDEGPTRVESGNGTVTNQARKAGQVLWSPAGDEQTVENISGKRLHAIEVELKPSVPSRNRFEVPTLDPVTVDPTHYRVEFENTKVRVIHCKYNPGESGVTHVHLHDRVVVYLTDKQIDVTTSDGTKHLLDAPADYLWWSGYAMHRDIAGVDPIEMIVVEFK